ncbi:hypothetical protein GH810_08935 [Acetobacterium paludosum]|uniref:Tetratricopeptide repeat protein n=1 Tax=Acetobacterium paludosum TaxID=52693 RepID=A0A923HWD0_9FIRM|nr:hypothetical protein [Acetobacterium paludosum]MBC3888430.1 hypothetical protein [Acetobacterium paludosum]
MIRKDFVELKHLYEDGKMFFFEEQLSRYTIQEIIEFSQYFSLNVQNKDEYYNVKMIAEIMYNLIIRTGNYCVIEIMEYAKNVIGRCMALSVDREAWKDVKKYSMFLLNYVTDANEICELQGCLSLAYFYLGNYEKELELRKMLLDHDDYLSLYNYALALFHNRKYEDARVYYKNCLEKFQFPPAYRNQAQISIILEDNYEEAYLLVKKATDVYLNNPNKFNIIGINTYVEHQLFLCGVCSSDMLFKELGLHKKKYENEIKNDKDAEKNTYYLKLISICCDLNRAIRYFEEMDYSKSFKLLNPIVNDVEREVIVFNSKSIFEESLKKITKVYIILIKIIQSLNLIFSDAMIEVNIDEKICKIDILRNEILSSEDNDFIYEYKKVISLFLKYIKFLLKYLFKGDNNEILTLYDYIERLRIKKSNYLLSTFMQCLYKLGTIYKAYEYDSKECYFIDELRKKSVDKIKLVCSEFSGKIREIATSVSVLQNDAICTEDTFCKLVTKAIRHIKNNVPSYVRNFKSNDITALHEEDFRDTLAVFFSSIYSVSSEEWKKEGRTDLIVNTNKNDRRVVEFKIWGRNDYKEVVGQIVERYLNQFDESGFIFMINSQKRSIKDKYLENIKNGKTSYVLNSLQIKSTGSIEYFVTRHRTEFNEYKIYHFIYNIFD